MRPLCAPQSSPLCRQIIRSNQAAARLRAMVRTRATVHRVPADGVSRMLEVPIEELVPSATVAHGTVLAQQVTIVIVKTPAGFTVSRTDDGTSAHVADATWAGGYLFLRNSGDDVAAISCASLTIS